MKDIPADSLIKNYFPVDYIDSFSKVMVTGQALTPEDFRNLAFSRFPKWIGWLMNFRNAIVKPLGLDTATRFTDMVLDKNLHEEILGMPDKHLDFHVSMWCGTIRSLNAIFGISLYGNRLWNTFGSSTSTS